MPSESDRDEWRTQHENPPAMHDLLVLNTGLKSRIAELEADCAALSDQGAEAGQALVKYEHAIAQAVAELEQGLAFRDVEGGAFSPIRAERALELLRGNRT